MGTYRRGDKTNELHRPVVFPAFLYFQRYIHPRYRLVAGRRVDVVLASDSVECASDSQQIALFPKKLMGN